MEALVDEGLVRSIGVSNFYPAAIDELTREARIKARPDGSEQRAKFYHWLLCTMSPALAILLCI
jgi:aryl-alcohol dehydrogenase-like predicted oxidoreductase